MMPEWTLSLNNRIIKRFAVEHGGSITIGRSSDADVVIDNTAISRQHATLELKAGNYFLTDHYSLNGTLVNGVKIEATVSLDDGDIIEIGKFILAPAPEGHVGESDSFSSAMDMNDDTIIISGKNKPTPQRPSVQPKAQHRLIIIQGEAEPKELYLAGKKNIKLGKDDTCDIVIAGSRTSATQCFIIFKENNYILVPQKTWIGGTSINGKKAKKETILRHGDIIETGKVKIKFD